MRNLALLCSMAIGLGACGTAPQGRTILLISLDSVRADTLDFDDLAAFPHLAQLARSGAVFDQAISSSSWTLPAHATIFTGAPPSLHGVEFDDIAIDPGFQTIPEMLHDAGWYTAGWWTGWYTAGEFGFARGFDVYTNAMTGGQAIERSYRDAIARGDIQAAKMLLAGLDTHGHRDITSPNVLMGVEATIETVSTERDLFLFTHLFDPHYDYVPPAPFDTRFDPDYTGDIDGHDFYLNRNVFDATKKPSQTIGTRDLKHVRALYKGEIAYVDKHIGLMLASLEAAGRLENTLVIVTADHGEEFFEHGGRGHRAGLYDEVLRVPLLVRDPRTQTGASEPRHIAAQVGLIDVFPTVAGFAGLEAPGTSLGLDLAPFVAGVPLESRPMISSLMQHHKQFGYLFMESYRLPTTKLVRSSVLGEDGQLELVRAQLFSLANDPQESRSLTTKQKATKLPIWLEMEAAFDQLRERFNTMEPVSRDARATTIRDVFADELGGLGYTDESGGSQLPASPGLSLPWPPGPRPRIAR